MEKLNYIRLAEAGEIKFGSRPIQVMSDQDVIPLNEHKKWAGLNDYQDNLFCTNIYGYTVYGLLYSLCFIK